MPLASSYRTASRAILGNLQFSMGWVPYCCQIQAFAAITVAGSVYAWGAGPASIIGILTWLIRLLTGFQALKCMRVPSWELTCPPKKGTFESMFFRTSQGGICDRSLEGAWWSQDIIPPISASEIDLKNCRWIIYVPKKLVVWKDLIICGATFI